MTITVTAAQVPSFLRGAWSDADVNAALSWAGNAVEAYCERNFSYVVNDVVLIDPYTVNRSAQLPNPPVAAVTLVEAWMRDQNGSTTWQTLTNYRWTAEGLIYDTTGQPGTDTTTLPSWPAAPKSLRVTYTHGFQVVPQAVIDATVKAAAAYLANPYNMTARRAADVSYQWSDNSNPVLDDSLLAKYRLITVPR